ncbi:MAG TPA: GGDEF domain-containing protein, partial [Bryobacteraceae bacterium]|nr:GGDEF domain-containing protein [Bryobacteraceae bacterium]
MTGKFIPDFSPIIETASDAIFLADTQGRLLYLNFAAMTLFGEPGSSLHGRSIFDYIPQSRRDAARRQWTSGQAGTIRTELIAGDGRESTVEISVTPLGPDQNCWCISRDVTAKVRMEAFEDARQAILEMLAGASPLAEILDQARSTLERYIPDTRCSLILEPQSGFDAGGRRQADCIPVAVPTPLTGHSEISPGVTVVLTRVNAEGADDSYSYCWSLRSTTEGLSSGLNPEIRLYRRDSRAPDEAESAILDRAYGLVRLALQHERLQNRLRHQAHHDPLTGLPNRALLMEFLDRSIQSAATQGTTTGLLFIDLDEFKLVNDTAGHGQGDRLLAEAARRMQDLLLRGSMLARMGGDEFTVVIPEVSKPEDAETVARHILRAFSRPFEVNGREQFVSASIGLCFYPEDAKTPSDLLRCADVAVYRAKAAGKGLFRRYN